MTLAKGRSRAFAHLSLAVLAAAAAGCSIGVGARAIAPRDPLAVIGRELDALLGVGAPSLPGPVSLTLAEACRLAAARDDRVLAAEARIAVSRTGREQAASMIWPRASLEGQLDFPIGGEADGSAISVEGGLFLRYDVLEVFTRGRRISAAELVMAREISARREAAEAAAWQTVATVCSIGARRRQLDRARAAAGAAREALDYVQNLERLSGAVLPESPLWIEQDLGRRRAVLDQERELAEHVDRMGRLVGAPPGSEATIVGADACAAAAGELTPPAELRGRVQQAAAARPDVAVARFDLALADLAIVDARQRAFPRLRIGLGLGHLQNAENRSAAVLPSAGVSIPLFDAGDSARAVADAVTARAAAEARLVGAVRQLVDQLRRAATARLFAAQGISVAEERCARARAAAASLAAESAVREVDPLRRARVRLAVLDAEAALVQAQALAGVAAVEERRSSGEAPPGFSPEAVEPRLP